eukprot:scpid72655/ scgid17456/ 
MHRKRPSITNEITMGVTKFKGLDLSSDCPVWTTVDAEFGSLVTNVLAASEAINNKVGLAGVDSVDESVSCIEFSGLVGVALLTDVDIVDDAEARAIMAVQSGQAEFGRKSQRL